MILNTEVVMDAVAQGRYQRTRFFAPPVMEKLTGMKNAV
jgi:hypothetical protein